ncbi:MAG: hypothetical protein NC038_07795 [Paludibacter sp.]|nr:hypothetical protein [Prevotella sp.]MCM1443645.1 hypothetical protein [Muribaculum sp.]MCM1482520.1 hypothetical protein [Paludibacter sp.]MCM1576896.1 hypothetical protein [Bacteroides sp.]
MTNKTAGILLLSGGALWYWVLRGVRAIAVKFERLRLFSVNVGSLSFNISVLIHNPLLVTVLVNEIIGDIYIMDVHCAAINYPLNQRIRAMGDSRLQVNFDVFPEQLGQALFSNISTGDIKTLLFRFDGYVKVGGIRIKIDKSFTFTDVFA